MKYHLTLICFLLGIMLLNPGYAQKQESLLQEEQEYRFAAQLSTRGMYDLAAHQFLQYADRYGSSPRAAEALFKAAENYELLQEPAKASSTYMRLLLSYPQSALIDKALFNQGKILSAAGEPLNAALTFERIRLFVPTSELVPMALLAASADFQRAGQSGKALDAARSVISDFPSHALVARARYQIAGTYKALQRPAAAVTELDKIAMERVDAELAVSVQLLKGQLFDELGRYALADSLLEALIHSGTVNDSVGVAAQSLARSLLRRGLTERSLKVVEKALQLNLDDLYKTQLRILQGDNYMMQSDLRAALRALDLADGELIPAEKIQLSFRKGVLQERLGEKALAISHYAQVIHAPDSSAAARMLRHKALISQTNLLAELGNGADALRSLRRHFDQHADLRDVILLQRGKIQMNYLQDSPSARRSFMMLNEFYPQSPLVDDAQWLTAESYQQQKEHAQARREYKRYIDLYPAGDDIDRAVAHHDYLQSFVPLQNEGAPFLTDLLLGHLAGDQNLTLARFFIEEQHDFKRGLDILRRLQRAGLDDDDHAAMLYLTGLAHARLCEKYTFAADSNQARLHLDSLSAVHQHLSAPFGKSASWTQTDALLKWCQWRLSPPSRQRVFLADALLQQEGGHSHSGLLRLDQAQFWYKTGVDSNSTPLLRRSGRLCSDLIAESSDPEMKAKALLLQSRIYTALQQPDSARHAIEWMLSRLPRTQTAVPAALELAQTYEKMGLLSKASDTYVDWAYHYFYSDKAGRVMGKACQLFLKQQQYEQARSCIERSDARTVVPELLPYLPENGDDEMLWLSAQTFMLQSDIPQAMHALKNYLLSSPRGGHRGEALLQLADFYAQSRNYQAALGHYEQVSAAGDDSLTALALIRKADLLYTTKEYKNAQPVYAQVKTLFKGEVQQLAAKQEVLCEYRAGSLARARILADAYRKQYKDRKAEAEFIYEDGTVCLINKDFRCAEDQFRELGSKYRDVSWGAEGELNLARLYVLLNRTEEALKLLTAIPNRYNDPRIIALAYVNLGEFYYENRQLENCITAGRSALEYPVVGPVRQRATELLIRVYDDLRLWDNAVVLLRHLIRDYPDDENAFNRKIQMGIFLINLKEYDRGIAALRELLPLADAENEAEIQYWIAKAYHERGDTAAAITEFLKVKYVCRPSKLPWGTTALYEAGQAYVKIGQLRLARSLFQEIVRELGVGDQFGRVANERVREIDAELAKSKDHRNG